MPTAKQPAEGAALSLVSKLAYIANQIGEKDPQRHSRDIKFPYHAAKDVYGWWRPLLHAQNILIVPSIIDSNVQQVTLPRASGGTRTTFLTTLIVRFTVYDGITGELIEGSAVGQGEDPSDKGSGKAMTYAEKAFLLGMGMNGSESDVEAFTDEEEKPRKVRVEASDIEGIERGGRSTSATEVQVRRVREMAGELGLDPVVMAELLEKVLTVEVLMAEDEAERGPAIRKALEALSAEDIGRLIQYMEIMLDKDMADAAASPY